MGSLHFIVLALVGLPCLAATGNMLALPIKLDYCGRFTVCVSLNTPCCLHTQRTSDALPRAHSRCPPPLRFPG